jgi:hypothetical protein
MEIRLAATRYIWTAFGLMMLALMSTSIFGNSSLGVGHVIIAVVLAAAAFLSTGMVWNWGDASNSSVNAVALATKQKRSSVERLANELDSMSEDDLEHLRTRLSGDVREVLTASSYGVTDDGELMRR